MKYSVSLIFLVAPVLLWAETSSFYTLSQVPGLEQGAQAAETGEFSSLINTLYAMAIGLGAVAAVFMIVFAGVRYAASDVAGVKADLKERITMALGGLVLLIGAYIFLSVINPNLTELQVEDNNDLDSFGLGFDETEEATVIVEDPTQASTTAQ